MLGISHGNRSIDEMSKFSIWNVNDEVKHKYKMDKIYIVRRMSIHHATELRGYTRKTNPQKTAKKHPIVVAAVTISLLICCSLVNHHNTAYDEHKSANIARNFNWV